MMLGPARFFTTILVPLAAAPAHAARGRDHQTRIVDVPGVVRLASRVPRSTFALPQHAGFVLGFDRPGPTVIIDVADSSHGAHDRRPHDWTRLGQRAFYYDVGLIHRERDATEISARVLAVAVERLPSRIRLKFGRARQLDLLDHHEQVELFGVIDPGNSFVDTFGIARAHPGEPSYYRDPGVLIGVQLRYPRRADFVRPDVLGLIRHVGDTPLSFADEEDGGDATPRVNVGRLTITRGAVDQLPPHVSLRLLTEVVQRAESRGCTTLLTNAAWPELATLGFARGSGGFWTAALTTPEFIARLTRAVKHADSRFGRR